MTEIVRRMKDELCSLFGHYKILHDTSRQYRNYTNLVNTKKTIGFEVNHDQSEVYFSEI